MGIASVGGRGQESEKRCLESPAVILVYRAILVAIVSQNSFVLVFFFVCVCGGGIAQVSCDTLQNGVSHRYVCANERTKAIVDVWWSAKPIEKASRNIRNNKEGDNDSFCLHPWEPNAASKPPFPLRQTERDNNNNNNNNNN